MKDRFVIGSNILIYMLNKDSGEKHRKALKFVRNARKKDAAIPVQCLAETYFQFIKKDVGTKRGRKAVKSLKNSRHFEKLSYTELELEKAINTQKNFWDKMIEQTALENSYEVIYTENTSDFEEIEAVNPLK